MRSLLRVGGVFLILSTMVLVGRSWSDTKPAQAPRARIAVVNLAYVVKHAEKAKALRDALKEGSKASEKRTKELQAQIDSLTKEVTEKPDTPADKREEAARKIKRWSRELEDVSEEAARLWSKENDKAMVAIYTEVRQAAQRYARAHDIDLVLQYNDAAEEKDLNSPTNIVGKLQVAGALPLYASPGVDITKEILAALNNKPRDGKEGN